MQVKEPVPNYSNTIASFFRGAGAGSTTSVWSEGTKRRTLKLVPGKLKVKIKLITYSFIPYIL